MVVTVRSGKKLNELEPSVQKDVDDQGEVTKKEHKKKLKEKYHGLKTLQHEQGLKRKNRGEEGEIGQ